MPISRTIVALCLPLFAGLSGVARAQSQTVAAAPSATPRVVIPTATAMPQRPVRPLAPVSRVSYPWKTQVTATVFWIGEQPSDRNPTPNTKSSWDVSWVGNFGGYDDPEPTSRVADPRSGDFRPKNFTPKLNPFYIALPYNDVMTGGVHRPEAARVIPWFQQLNPDPGKTVCKGRWLQIYYGGKSCFAQWQDCGPWLTHDWEYVFGDKPPRNQSNQAAGIDISPAVRDYLGLASGQKVHWRFVEASQVPYGPWKKYGQDGVADPALEAQRKYMEALRKQRDEQFQKKSLSELQG